MLNEWNKCNFCKHNTEVTCTANECWSHDHYSPDPNKLIAKAKELGISVTDVIALINL